MQHNPDDSIPVSNGATAGAATYTKGVLAVYDPIVIRFENSLVWKCPSPTMVAFYNRHVSSRHLAVGVGSGYFLDTCTFPSASPTIHLLDLNPNSLEATAHRIRRYSPVPHLWNVLEPIEFPLPSFASICMNYLLHCLPGSISEKGVAFENLSKFLDDDGTLFGSTILGKGVEMGLLGRVFNRAYNDRAIFTNLEDDLEGLEATLRSVFRSVSLELVGSVALFSCKK